MRVAAVQLRRLSVTLALAWGFTVTAESQVPSQSFQIAADSRQPTIGDTVTLSFRVRLDERDLLLDTVPQPLGVVPEGVRVISVDKLARAPDRIFHGKARLTFYRPGRQPVPVFMLPFMRIVEGVQRATLASDSAFVIVGAILPAGNPPLKDIREIELHRRPSLIPAIAAGIALILLLSAYVLRRRRHSVEPKPVSSPAIAPSPSPYSAAVAQLDSIERERWPARGDVARHYEEIVDVVRAYVDAREGVPAGEQTTEELLWALPPHLAEAGRETLRELLEEADLVKFARLVPDMDQAERFLERTRLLLRHWQEAGVLSQAADAIR